MNKKENTILHAITTDTCTGCGGCVNACPVDAISMSEDGEGFLFPRIDETICVSCGKCSNVCPVLHSIPNKNFEDPALYAVRASDNIRKKSSSGGAFTLLAEYVLRKKGYVVGAVFDENMVLHHTMTDCLSGLDGMRGSKYLQSDTRFVYREVKKRLDQGKMVLFTGCPCQAAALRGYLEKDYEQLYIVDILCHGVPSQKIFQRYLKEQSGEKQVTAVKFRDKRYGWISTKIRIEYEDGTFYEGDFHKDVYEKIFQHSIALRKICTNCKFNDFPRQGDITMGDFWGIERIDKTQNDGKGTSLVFINNKKGEKLFQKAKNVFTKIQEMQIPIEEIPNRIKPYYPAHAGRERFFDLIQNHTMEQAVQSITKNLYDVGLVGIYTVSNFGGAVTYFALQKVITNMGYSCLLIERPMDAPEPPLKESMYHKMPFKDYERSKFYANKEEMYELNNICQKFVVGSDQMFNDCLYNNFGRWCTLDWVKDSKIKIAYAASFGHDYIWSPEETRAEMAYFMQKFDRFSVREKSGVDLAYREFGTTATWVLDPVFLCDVQEYIKLTEQAENKCERKYIGAYILDPTLEKQKLLKKISKELHLELSIYSEIIFPEHDSEWTLPLKKGYIEDYLNNIYQSEFFVADSFHGVCLAIIFRKNFIAVSNKKRGKSRLESILGLLGLGNRLLDEASDYTDQLLNEPIDYQQVDLRLNEEKRRCINWLSEALSLKTKKTASTYDIVLQRINRLERTNNELEIENTKLRSRMNSLISGYDWEYVKINNITQYFDRLIQKKEDLILVIAVKDTPGYLFTKELADKMEAMGFRTNLQEKHWYAYIGVLYNGQAKEILSKDGVAQMKKKYGQLKLEVVSKAYPYGNVANIIINEREYAVNERGLNIVLIQKSSLRVIDSVCFDTHKADYPCYRW